jgi:hypothetical protein
LELKNREKQMNTLTNEILVKILSAQKAPCLSLYQSTHRRHPENQQDPIRFRNLIKKLDILLKQGYPEVDAERFMKPFEALAHDAEFWNHTLDGIAVLLGTDVFYAVTLPQSVTELVIAADNFHTKPLRRFLQSVDRYQVLGLDLQNIRLFEGNRHDLAEIELVPEVPRTIAAALGADLTEPHQTVASFGGVGMAGTPVHHGRSVRADDADVDAERFFRTVDRAVTEHYSKPFGLPLILAALPEHHHLFHQVSRNPYLTAEGIHANPNSLSLTELCILGWQIVEPEYKSRMAVLREDFEQARAKGLGSDDLAEVAKAAADGRVATLLLEADRRIAGRLDSATGRIAFTFPNDPKADDLFDDLGELTAKMGGMVMVVPGELMPMKRRIAATYRY